VCVIVLWIYYKSILIENNIEKVNDDYNFAINTIEK
jgi:hypothetical protein